MLNFLKKYLNFSGAYSKKLKKSFVYSFLDGILLNFPIVMFIYLLQLIQQDNLNVKNIIKIGTMLLVSVLIRMLVVYRFNSLQSLSAYEICARERISVGDKLKRFNLGFFNEGNLGRVTTILTQELVFFEEQSFHTFGKIVNAYATLIVGNTFILLMNYKIGLFSVAMSIIGLIKLKKVTKVGEKGSRIRQKQQEKLTYSILEYVMGIEVIKSYRFNNNKEIEFQKIIDETKNKSISFEKDFIKPAINYTNIFSITTAGIIFISLMFYNNGLMDASYTLGFSLFAFFLFLPVQALAPESGILAVTEACLKRFEDLKKTKIIDENCIDKKIEKYDIEFKNVDFSYESGNNTLKNVNLSMKPMTMNALVGHSGSGKTTVANLIMRFWDIDSGIIKIGDNNIKDITCDSLLKNISAVFQRVYLFNDSILNNIKFAKPDATMEEVIDAAKAARCHGFISRLKNGYNTQVDAGGNSLSGGEKQRISLARAILKDAPIVILDEATSSVDPDNEYYIQQAIDELVKGKTVIVIAHRLHTIKNANQIIVMENGEVEEIGTHRQLIEKRGVYNTLWEKRNAARSWEIKR